jgi:hypothetical protein
VWLGRGLSNDDQFRGWGLSWKHTAAKDAGKGWGQQVAGDRAGLCKCAALAPPTTPPSHAPWLGYQRGSMPEKRGGARGG